MRTTGLASTCRRALGSMAQAHRHERAHKHSPEVRRPLSTLPVDLYRYDATASASASAIAGLCAVAPAPCNSHTRSARPRGVARRAPHTPTAAATLAGGSAPDDNAAPSTSQGASSQSSYTLEDTRTLVETAMLAAVSGLSYLLSTILKLENSLGYFLPLPVVLAALRGGGQAGWRTMSATCFLLVVLLGPLRAMSYLLIHGLFAATLGSLWHARASFWVGVTAGAVVRMIGQLTYLVMTSITMNENMFALLLSNIYSMLDNITAMLGISGAPPALAVRCMVFSMLLMNGVTYCFLVHVVYRVVLGTMGYQLGPLPGLLQKYLESGMVRR